MLSDIPTFRELWSDCAVFHRPGDADGLADAARELLGDAARRQALAAAAKARALERYSPARMAADYETLYREVAERPSRQPVVAD